MESQFGKNRKTALENAFQCYEGTRGGKYENYHSHAVREKCTVDDRYVYLRDENGDFLLAWFDHKNGIYHEV
jgi:hypothetical protein